MRDREKYRPTDLDIEAYSRSFKNQKNSGLASPLGTNQLPANI